MLAAQEFVFHSIFACPVSKDQATEENPPMLLPCGHVLCKACLSLLKPSSPSMCVSCRSPSVMRSAGSSVRLIGSPIDFAGCLTGSPITGHYTVGAHGCSHIRWRRLIFLRG